MKYPNKLNLGDTIGVIAGSSPISKEREIQCKETLEKLGYKVKLAKNLAANYAGYMAGQGKVRGEAINEMFADSEVDAVICVRGGYAGSRAMEYVDFEIIKNNPKIFVGYSDVTSLHCAINKLCNIPTFHGPMVSSNMVDNFDEETKASLYQALNAEAAYEFKNPKGFDIKVLKEGSATGQMIGGNLAVLCATIGTFYEVDTKDKIIFLEEVGEHMGRIERFAYQLKAAGKFAQCRGVVLGQFTDCENPNAPDYMELEFFKDILHDYDIPVIYNVQSGHDTPNMTLTFGATCTIDTDSRTIKYDKPLR